MWTIPIGKHGGPEALEAKEVLLPEQLLGAAQDGLAQPYLTQLNYAGTWGGSSAGRAPRSHRGGQGFDPPPLHQ